MEGSYSFDVVPFLIIFKIRSSMVSKFFPDYEQSSDFRFYVYHRSGYFQEAIILGNIFFHC